MMLKATVYITEIDSPIEVHTHFPSWLSQLIEMNVKSFTGLFIISSDPLPLVYQLIRILTCDISLEDMY